MARKPRPMSLAEARRRAIAAQRLDATAPFGAGPAAVQGAVEHLGYVQIDTINVIERSHHHILWSRIPAYRRADLASALSEEKTVFEYWAHALAYICRLAKNAPEQTARGIQHRAGRPGRPRFKVCPKARATTIALKLELKTAVSAQITVVGRKCNLLYHLLPLLHKISRLLA